MKMLKNLIKNPNPNSAPSQRGRMIEMDEKHDGQIRSDQIQTGIENEN